GCRLAGFEQVFVQIFGLVFQMAEIRTIRQRARSLGEVGRHGGLLSWLRPLSAPRAERRFAKINFVEVGFYPFRGPDASFNAVPMLPKSEERGPVQKEKGEKPVASKFSDEFTDQRPVVAERDFSAQAESQKCSATVCRSQTGACALHRRRSRSAQRLLCGGRPG